MCGVDMCTCICVKVVKYLYLYIFAVRMGHSRVTVAVRACVQT